MERSVKSDETGLAFRQIYLYHSSEKTCQCVNECNTALAVSVLFFRLFVSKCVGTSKSSIT
ncbi:MULTISPECIES: hypothetical protein [Bartonella]|uniref:hypothetical protein n=1 Tax=Bartonella TaxID=773 RepID=UPI0018DC609B|nr:MULTISPECIES: hypothetical protein [Bartonella]MBH9975657.1 hypothetical protein [Bartonella choladocola]MBI0015264.1 hypothetical protein [Bartonella sp. B10834G3]